MKNILFFAILLMLASCQKCEEQPTSEPVQIGKPTVSLTLDGGRIVMEPWKVDSMSNGRVDCHYKDAQSQIIMLCVFKDQKLYIEPNGFYKGRSFVILHETSPIRLELCGDNDDVITYDDINLSFIW
jgi:hypothetical protein